MNTERSDSSTLLLSTGADKDHFHHLKILIGSWLTHLPCHRLVVCDFGLLPEQLSELALFPRLYVLPAPEPIDHPWLGKALLGSFLQGYPLRWDALLWIDADACFTHPFPALTPLLEGYDLIADAHVQAVGEITHEGNLERLGLRRDDAYFAAGWWIARRGVLLDNYLRLTRLVKGQGNLWEGDAFVAAIYQEKLRVRTVCGSIWHCRGKTSLHSCEVRDLTPFHAGQPIYVLHANEGYVFREDGRRVFKRPELARIQDHFENFYLDYLRARRASLSLALS